MKAYLKSLHRLDVIAAILILLAFSITVSAIGATVIVNRQPPPTERIEATILEVLDSPSWANQRTLVEFEDGTRKILLEYYGQPGDTFIVERRSQ